MKTCSKCGVEKSRDEFSKRQRARDGLHSWCRQCASEYMADYMPRYRKDSEVWQKHNGPRARFARRLRSRFGITLEEYDALVAQPCALCGTLEGIVLDHCHNTGRIRGPLCHLCNRALGFFGDNPASLRAAADYLERHA